MTSGCCQALADGLGSTRSIGPAHEGVSGLGVEEAHFQLVGPGQGERGPGVFPLLGNGLRHSLPDTAVGLLLGQRDGRLAAQSLLDGDGSDAGDEFLGLAAGGLITAEEDDGLAQAPW